MLALKKMSWKKSAIYTSIILLMLLGTAFMLYQNQKLTSGQTAVNGAPSAESSVARSGSSTAASTVTSGQSVNKIKKPGELDLTIFSSEKFKNLKDNPPIIKEQPGVGKRNPFNPE